MLVDGLCITVNLMGPGLVCESSAWCCYVNAHLAINLIIITGDMNDKAFTQHIECTFHWCWFLKMQSLFTLKLASEYPIEHEKKMTVFSVFCLCVYLFILPMYVKFLVIFQGERFYELACLVAVRKDRTDLKKLSKYISIVIYKLF